MRILFVCMGNICRSPTAEVVLRERARRAGVLDALMIDSAGTHDYHVGRPPDRRAREAAMRRGYDMSALRARQVVADDLIRFDRIYAMDHDNLAALNAVASGLDAASTVRPALLLDVCTDPWTRDVPDPYYGGKRGFEDVLDLIEQAVDAIVDGIVAERRAEQGSA